MMEDIIFHSPQLALPNRNETHAAHVTQTRQVPPPTAPRAMRFSGCRLFDFRDNISAEELAQYYRLRDRVEPDLKRRRSASPVVELAAAMAELDVRRDQGGRGQMGRKRRFREDDDSDRRPQRRRYEEPVANRLRRQLLAIAESPLKNAQEEANYIGKNIAEHFEDEDVKASIPELAVQLVVEQPFKIPFVAAVVLNANEAKPDVAREIVAKAAAKLQTHLDAGNWREVKLLLRLLACLQGLFEGEGVFPVLDELFNRAVDLQTASQEDAVGLELVKIILLTLPYALASTATDLEQKASELLEKTDVIASAPHALEALVEPYIGDSDEKPFGYQSIIGLLQKQLQKEASRGWELACIPRLYQGPTVEIGADAPVPPMKHAFPPINVPSPINPGPKPLFPETYFSLYADQDVETVPRTTDIAASLLRDCLVDTINILDFNRNATARFLIDIDCFWAPDTFVKRATPYDKLRDLEGDKSTWKPEDMAVDAVFSQIFQLPTPEHKLIYYHSVITECCKIAPAAIAPSLGRAIRFLFRHLDLMDMELSYRFMDWFAHHLSNFEFRWKWTEWLDDIDRPNLHPKKAFIIGALDKEIRLSFAKRIRETLPEQYHPLIPEGKDKDTPDFKYNNDQTPYAQEGREILALIRKKAPESDIQEVINKIHEEAAAHGIADVLVPSTDAYVTAICYIGSKSLSHVLSCIERCKERLLAIGPQSEAARLQIIQSVVDYWKDQPGTAVNIVDKLLNYTILSPMSVVQWALGPERLGTGAALANEWLYEMVAGTVRKVTTRVRQIVTARVQAQGRLPEDQIAMLDDTLVRERDAMRQLFAAIEDAVSGVAQGASDGFIEADGSKEFGEAEGRLVKGWGGRWARVFRRKGAVEEAVVGEMAVQAAVEAAAAAVEASAGMTMDSAVQGATNGEADIKDEADVQDEIL